MAIMSEICPNCRERERSYDGESGSYCTYCYECFNLFSCKPYCYHPECSRRICGTQTRLINGYEAAHGATALYECPNGHGAFSRLEWRVQAETASGTRDATEDLELAKCRLIHIRKTNMLTGEHEENRVGKAAYVAAVKKVLGELPIDMGI